jgi:hypothetical protein
MYDKLVVAGMFIVHEYVIASLLVYVLVVHYEHGQVRAGMLVVCSATKKRVCKREDRHDR